MINNRCYAKSHECVVLDDFELYNVHAEDAEREKWSIFSTKIHYVEYKRKELPTNTVNFKATKSGCQKGYRQLKGKSKTCQEIDFDNMIDKLQTDCLDRYEAVQAEL